MITAKFNSLRLLLFASVYFFSVQAQEYPQLILAGDYPDPSIIRDGEDYYMTHSPFYYLPGFLIWHSQDLINWTPLCRALSEFEGSAMAPDLVKYKERYYIYYPAAGTNWVTWANNIRGPWSKPINLNVGYIDPGHVIGEDGKRYLYLSEGMKIELSEDGLSTIGKPVKAYDGWNFPQNWETEGKWLESPKFIKKGDYFYLISAQGGTAGPPTSHMVIAARSKSIHGPWENSPYNPVIRTYSPDDPWWSKGHGTLIDDKHGNWWIVYHAYANNYHTLGRQTLLEPIEWTSDGWFRTQTKAIPITDSQQIQHGMKPTDNFSGNKPGLQWTFWKEYAPESITLKKNSLYLQAKGNTPADARLLLTTATDKSYETEVKIETGKNNQAGLILYYNEKAYAGVTSDGKEFTIYANAENKIKIPNTFGKEFSLKIINQGNKCSFYAGKYGTEWIPLATDMDVSQMHHNNYKGFYALRIALLSAGKGKARFRDFRYKNTIPEEKDIFQNGTTAEKNIRNPILPGLYADPEIIYAEKTGKYYIYPTSDGFKNWAGDYFKVFSSENLMDWTDEGIILDLKKDVSWANTNAWAPCIIEKKEKNGSYKYYYYFTAAKQIGVAIAENPTGPFIDSGKPLIGSEKPSAMPRGQNIDPAIFTDPEDGTNYLYWGNYYMAVCELNDDMISIKPHTTKILISDDTYYSEAPYVFYRNGFYYISWSKNDTRSEDYEVRYVKTKSPTNPIDPSLSEVILKKDPGKGIYATGHHSILQIPGKDEWYIVYHRFKRPEGIHMGSNAGYNREVCIDKLEFNENGTIKKIVPTI